MKTATDYDYGKEFDREVENYNQWLSGHSSMEKAKERARKRKSFATGVYSLIDGLYSILGTNVEMPLLMAVHPIQRREDLSSAQKDAIVLASDLKRVPGKVKESLEARCSRPEKAEKVQEATETLLRPLYEFYQSVYVAHAVRKT